MINRILSLMARVELQFFWNGLHRVVLGGMGYMNADADTNGEMRYLRNWARQVAVPRDRPLVIFDVGANEGEFAELCPQFLAGRPFQLHCFEPNAAAFGRLQDRFGGDPRFHLNNVGVGDAPGQMSLFEQAGENGSRLASFLPDTFSDIYPSEVQSQTAEIVTIDDYAQSRGIDRIDFVKIDVEGFEKFVLRGMSGLIDGGKVERIQFEVNAHNALTGLSILKISHMLPGFRISRLLSNGTVPVAGPDIEYNARAEIFKYANFVAEYGGPGGGWARMTADVAATMVRPARLKGGWQ